MKKLMSRIVVLTVFLTLSACGSSSSETGSLSKEDAKKIVNPDRDLCEVHSWYGDGVCDTFCENADSDCTVQCDGLPVCDSDEFETETCSQADFCREVTVCGATIICEDLNDDLECLISPVFECNEGDTLVEACLPNGAECYEIQGYCGDPVQYCQVAPTCDAEPVCAADYIEVDSCPTDTDCQEVTVCGSTISCQSQCENPAQPMCPADRYLIQTCPADSNCTEEVICGISVSCMEGTIDCLNPPECPVGTTEVPVCVADKPCDELIECGVRLYCEENLM